MLRSGFSSQSGGSFDGRSVGFWEGLVFVFELRDDAEDPLPDDFDDIISSLEESSLRPEVLPAFEEANRRLRPLVLGTLDCHPIRSSRSVLLHGFDKKPNA